jgi:hypothetical protein
MDRTSVLVHVPSGQIFELNETGTRIWELLAGGSGPGTIPDQLVTEFAVTPLEATTASRRLIAELAAAGLLS